MSAQSAPTFYLLAKYFLLAPNAPRPKIISKHPSLLYQPSQRVTDDRPIAVSDGHDFPGLIDEGVPGVAAVIDDVVEGFEDAVRQPVLAHELPDIFLAV